MSSIAPTSLVIDTQQLEKLGIDGPALKVTMRGKSAILFPLRRLCRIHLLGTRVSGLDALMQCAEHNIPIAFFKRTGQLRCRLLPPNGERAVVDHWFEHIEFDQEINQIYDNWRTGQTLYTLSQLGFNQGGKSKVQHKLAFEALRKFGRKILGKNSFETAMEWLNGLLSFQIMQIIESFGFIQPSARERILKDILPLCLLGLLYGFVHHLHQNREFTVTPMHMTKFYQLQSNEIEFSTRRMLIQLVNQLEAVV